MTTVDKVMTCCVVEVLAVLLLLALPNVTVVWWWSKLGIFSVFMVTLGYESYLKIYKGPKNGR